MALEELTFHFERSSNGIYMIVVDKPIVFSAYEKEYAVSNGYVSNGMSVPRALWSLISPQYDPVTIVPSVCHDWMYDNHVMDRKSADRWYWSALVSNGYPVWKADVVYVAIRLFGGSHW